MTRYLMIFKELLSILFYVIVVLWFALFLFLLFLELLPFRKIYQNIYG